MSQKDFVNMWSVKRLRVVTTVFQILHLCLNLCLLLLESILQDRYISEKELAPLRANFGFVPTSAALRELYILIY